MMRNPASGRVLQAAGMEPEGVLRQRVRKWGRYEDVVLYAILRDNMDEQRQ
jgi:RimJ/RimL family protein N-acetyltransferase